MSKLIDLTNRKFGRLTVIKRAENNKHNQVMWLCKCSCGAEKIVNGSSLKAPNGTRSCGCLHNEMLGKERFKHGKVGTRLYKIWAGIKNRCLNPNEPAYKHYGGRGITVCDEWKDNFQPFYDWAIANGYKDDLSIDRIDVNGNYEPSNCRWADRKTQNRNKTNNHKLTFNGKTQTLQEWAYETGINYQTLQARIDVCKWTIDRALTTPVKHNLSRTTKK